MKKYFTRLLTLAVIAPALVSCAEQLPDFGPQAKKHTVYFSTAEEATRTGLSIDDGIVTPDWRDTDVDDVHVFEMDGTHDGVMGQTTDLSMDEEYLAANFKVDFEEDMTIYVETPPSPTLPADGTRASGSVTRASGSGYTYGAVVAKMKESEEEPVFYIDATQKPDPNTLKDPGAEFLIGFSRDAYDAAPDGESIFVDLYFDRVAALSRIGFSEFQGTNEKVMSVKINSETSMTGSVPFNGIIFANTCSIDEAKYTPDAGPGVLTLDYADGVSATDFYAYFVSMPGTFNITSIEVLTDQYHYTKTVGKSVTFDLLSLKDLRVDLSTAEKEEIAPAQEVWYKASVLVDGYDYLIVSAGQALKNNEGTADVLAVSPQNGIITFESVTDQTIIWRATAHTEMTAEDGVIAGHFILTNDGYYVLRTSGSAVGLGTSIPADKPKYAVWDYDGAYLKHFSDESRLFYWFYSSNKWTTGYTDGDTAPGSSIGTVDIYTNRAPQELSFDGPGPFEYNLDDPTVDFQEPILSEHYGEVTYTSSDENKATVAADGNVTFIKAGQVTITATAAGDATHQAASASYVIDITSSQVRVYNKVTSIANLEVGAQYLLVYETSSLVFKPILEDDGANFAKTTENKLAVEISSSTITSNELEDYELTLMDGYYIYVSSADRYLYPYTSSDGRTTALYAESSPQHALTVTINSDGTAKIADSDGSYLNYSTNNNGRFSSSRSSTLNVCLYKLDDGRQTQSPRFSPTEVNYDIAGSAALTKPTLSDAHGTVTYTSSDTDIATVDRSSGDVTVKNRGTVTITANAAGDTSYKPGSASYTLVIINSSIVDTYYVLVTSEPGSWDGTYLIVNTAADGTGTALNGTETATVTITGGKILSTPEVDGYALTVTSAGEIHPNQTDDSQGLIAYDINFYDGNWLYWYSSAYKQTTETRGDRHNKCTIYYDNGGVRLMSAGYKVGLDGNTLSSVPSKNYLYYQSSGSFTMSSSHASDRVQLYMLDDGRVPQTLSFNPETATYDIYVPSSFVKPTLLNAHGTVTYSSSNDAIAEVDDSGNITGHKKGTVTITATAAGDTQYKPGSATYTLTVENSDPSAPTNPVYTKVMSSADIVAGQKYLIVYESGASSKAFKPIVSGTTVTESAANAIDAPVSNNEITSTEDIDACQVFLMAATDGYYYIKTGDSYLYPGSSKLQAESSSTRPLAITISSGKLTIKRSQYDHYLVFNSYFRRAGSDSGNLALYTLDDGSNPGGGDDPQPPTPSTVTYTKVNSITSGATYLIVSPSDDGLFTGTTAGGVQSVTPENGVITSSSYSDYEFVITEEASGMYSIMYQGQYLYCNGNFSGTNATAIGYQGSVASLTLDNTQISDSYAFGFKMNANSADQFLYFKSSTLFKWGGSGKSTGVHLYKKADNP